MNKETDYKVKVEKKDDSTVEIQGEIPADIFESFRKNAMKKLSEGLEVKGFRKGNVPERVLIEKVGEQTILYEMAEMALSESYPKILTDEKIDAISQPQISITKIASGNPLGFTIKTTVMPEVKLPDYKKIAGEINSRKTESVEVTDEEFSSSINQVKRSILAKQKGQEEAQKAKDDELPELTDENVKKLGDYEGVSDFKEKLKEGLLERKKQQQKEKGRLEIIERLIKEASVEVPDVLINHELDRMVRQFRHDIEKMGMKPEEYFEKVGKNIDEMKKEWKADARKRVQSELVLVEIGKKEKLKPTEEEIAKEVDHLASHYPDADERALRAHVGNVLHHQKVLEFLEKQGV